MRRIWLASMFLFPVLLHAQRASDLREGARLQITPVRGSHVILGAGGAIIGAVAGAIHGRENWRPVRIPRG